MLWLIRTSALFFALVPFASCADAQGLKIQWEVANRFRLFTEQAQFDRHVKAAADASDRSILAAEQELAAKDPKNGWAANVGPLCFNSWTGQIAEPCKRDGTVESYLNPKTSRIVLTAVLPADFGQAACTWVVGTGTPIKKDCGEPVDDARVSLHKATSVTVTARNASGATLQATTTVAPHDILIVGLGDSIASGEGNPAKPVALSDQGFCYRRFFSGPSSDFLRPGRADAHVHPDCPEPGEHFDELDAWNAAGASWLYNPCHLSLYSYQVRAALALAVENKTISVTVLPLGCTGAGIRDGILGPQPAHERPKRNGKTAPRNVEAQISKLTHLLQPRGGRGFFRLPDLMFLTIGANDVGFSGLVANVMITGQPERRLAGKAIVAPAGARAKLKSLRKDFQSLRTALHPFLSGKPERVLFAAYGNPAMRRGEPCPSSRRGFDIQPAFSIDGDALKTASKFVETEFIPALKSYASAQRMTFVDGHRAAFADHGFCAEAESDPPFDRDCLRDGDTFLDRPQDNPMACGQSLRKFLPYGKRARWIRTANDSYFAAMTYPTGGSLIGNPSDIHDALWGVEDAVYGGAIHPTAEGHAAMADAVLAAARRVLGLAPPAVASLR